MANDLIPIMKAAGNSKTACELGEIQEKQLPKLQK
jgi:hypothetical protein